jgi:DNA polymerase-3 subunit delta
MVIYIYGNNTFAIGKQLEAIKNRYFSKNADNADFTSYDLSSDDTGSFVSDLSTVPMFASSRLVFAENPASSKLGAEELLELIGTVPDSTNLVFVDYAPDKRTAIFKKLSALSGAKEFKPTAPGDLPKWVQAEAKRAGAQIDYNTARFLVDYVGSDEWLLHNEIQKLSAANSVITKATIESLSSPSLDSTAFQLAEALVKKDLPKALDIYTQLQQQGSADQQIMGAIIYQYRTMMLAMLGDTKLISAYKLSPYPLSKARALINGLDIDDIKKAYGAIAKADMATKTGELSSGDAMKGLFYSLSS